MKPELQNVSDVNILLVEDDMIHTFIAETCLKNHFNVDSVTNGHDALKAIEKKQYDVILMDINLNDHTLDGIQTMHRIKFKRQHRRVKIIAVTASSDAREWFVKQGFDGHYMKPVIEASIVEEINALLQKNVRLKTTV